MFDAPKGESLHEIRDRVDISKMHAVAESSRKVADELKEAIDVYMKIQSERPLTAVETSELEMINEAIEELEEQEDALLEMLANFKGEKQ